MSIGKTDFHKNAEFRKRYPDFTKRLISQDGHINVRTIGSTEDTTDDEYIRGFSLKFYRDLLDIYVYIATAKIYVGWGIFSVIYSISWLSFAVLWYCIAVYHNDMDCVRPWEYTRDCQACLVITEKEYLYDDVGSGSKNTADDVCYQHFTIEQQFNSVFKIENPSIDMNLIKPCNVKNYQRIYNNETKKHEIVEEIEKSPNEEKDWSTIHFCDSMLSYTNNTYVAEVQQFLQSKLGIGGQMPDGNENKRKNWCEGDKCLQNVDSFVDAVLFSIETQVTIGYGDRVVNDDCMIGCILLILQTFTGTILDITIIGCTFVKMTQPDDKQRLKFAKKACINMRDGCLYFTVKVMDTYSSILLDCNVSMKSLNIKTTKCHRSDKVIFFFDRKRNFTENELEKKYDDDRLGLVNIQENSDVTSTGRSRVVLDRSFSWVSNFSNLVGY